MITTWTLRVTNPDGTTRDETFASPEARTEAAMAYSRQGVTTLGLGEGRAPTAAEERDVADLFASFEAE